MASLDIGRRFCAAALALLVAGVFAVGAAEARVEFDGGEIEAWADAYFGAELDARRITGASVGVIQDGEVVFLKGYGWQDFGRGIPLDPEKTMIRMCSISKTFTATAIMQLLERGLIQSLDDPVNKYLTRYQLPPPRGGKVTIRQLMTHSSGMAGHFSPQGALTDIDVPVASDDVARFFSENIEREPGAIGQYANLGVALESVMIEDLTGAPLRDYFADNIFRPLGMSPAVLHHVVEPPANLAVPYGIFPNGDLQAVPFHPKHPLTAASGGVITTTAELLKYAAMHADEDAAAHADVLSSDARKTMHQRQFGHHPADPGIGLHFYVADHAGERFISHGCGLPGTRSLMGVFPESNAGVAISVFSAAPQPSVKDLAQRLTGRGRLVQGPDGPKKYERDDRQSPWDAFLTSQVGPLRLPDPSAVEPPPEMVADPDDLAGVYWLERRSLTTFASFFAANGVLRVEEDADGGLLIDGDRFNEAAPGVYDSEDGDRRRFFRRPDPNGPVFLHTWTSTSFRQMPAFANPQALAALFSIGFLASLSGLAAVFWPRGLAFGGLAKGASVGAGATAAAILAAFVVGYDTLAGITERASNGDVRRIASILALTNAHLALGVVMIFAALRAWTSAGGPSGVGSLIARVHLAALGLAAFAMWPGALLFHIVGWNLR